MSEFNEYALEELMAETFDDLEEIMHAYFYRNKKCWHCGNGATIDHQQGCVAGGIVATQEKRRRQIKQMIQNLRTRPPALGELSDTVLFNLYAEMNAVYVLSGKIPSAAQVAKAAREFLGKVDG